jgi:hypothetical protein
MSENRLKDSPEYRSVHVVPTEHVPDGIAVSYNTFSHNKPNSFGDTWFIWKGIDDINWEDAPVYKQTVGFNKPDSDDFITYGTEARKYLVGYGVGPDPSQTCATFVLNDSLGTAEEMAAAAAESQESVHIKKVLPLRSLLVVTFQTLPGYKPAKNHNWIALWESDKVPMGDDADEPLAWTKIDSDSNNSSVRLTLTNTPLKQGHTYVVGYFMGPKMQDPNVHPAPTALAASAKFTIAEPS